MVARLAGAIDLEQRTIDLVIADLESALPHVRHVTVGGGYGRTRVHPLIPHFKLGMACLDQSSAAVGMIPFLDFLFVLERNDVFHLQALRPREREPLIRWLKVV